MANITLLHRGPLRGDDCYTRFVDVSSLLFGHSKALYSTWMFYKPDHLLVDCGEGAATSLGNGGFAIERVLLTHGHIDHIAGLPPLLWSRAAGMGDTQKPLDVYFPRDDAYVSDMQSYLRRTQTRMPFALRWIPLDAGDTVELQGPGEPPRQGGRSRPAATRRLVAFATRHIRDRLTLGYKVVETRRRLKPEYAGLAQEEIRALALKNGRDGARALSEEYEAILAAFGGDGLALDAADVGGAELLVHEATILDAADRKHQWHATLDEAVRLAAEVRPRALVLCHISGRYRTDDVRMAVCASGARYRVDFPIWCLYRDRLWKVREGQSGAAPADSATEGEQGEH